MTDSAVSVTDAAIDFISFHNNEKEIAVSEEWLQNTLGTNFGFRSFPIGAFTSGVLLPDEPIEYTQIFPRGQCNNWCIKANEILCQESFKFVHDSTAVKLGPSVSDIGDVSYVAHRNRLTIEVNGVVFRMSPNNVRGLFLSSFLEEVNGIVGQNNLFKRSLQLIKSWCFYDSRQYTTKDFNAVFNHDTLTIMTMWLFATRGPFQHPIDTPLRALLTFLAEFSAFRWDSHAVTATHSISLADLPASLTVADGHTAEPRTNDYDSLLRPATAESLEGHDANFQLEFARIADAYRRKYEADFPKDKHCRLLEQKNGLHVAAAATSSLGCDRYYVLDPVSGSYNVCENCSPTKCVVSRMEMVAVFTAGFEHIRQVLTDLGQPSPSSSPRSTGDLLARLMPITWSVVHQRQSLLRPFDRLPKPVYPNAAGGFLELLKHAELTISAKITSDILIKLIVEVLTLSGPLPIGEIGKQLQLATGNANLPKILKKSFSGLKNFVTSYPALFSLGDNHDFNPYVYLTSTGKDLARGPADVTVNTQSYGPPSVASLPQSVQLTQPQQQLGGVGLKTVGIAPQLPNQMQPGGMNRPSPPSPPNGYAVQPPQLPVAQMGQPASRYNQKQPQYPSGPSNYGQTQGLGPQQAPQQYPSQQQQQQQHLQTRSLTSHGQFQTPHGQTFSQQQPQFQRAQTYNGSQQNLHTNGSYGQAQGPAVGGNRYSPPGSRDNYYDMKQTLAAKEFVPKAYQQQWSPPHQQPQHANGFQNHHQQQLQGQNQLFSSRSVKSLTADQYTERDQSVFGRSESYPPFRGADGASDHSMSSSRVVGGNSDWYTGLFANPAASSGTSLEDASMTDSSHSQPFLNQRRIDDIMQLQQGANGTTNSAVTDAATATATDMANWII